MLGQAEQKAGRVAIVESANRCIERVLQITAFKSSQPTNRLERSNTYQCPARKSAVVAKNQNGSKRGDHDEHEYDKF